MAIQDDINGIDPAKPVDFDVATGSVPSISSIRANFAALKSAMQGLLDLVGTLASSSLSSLVLTGVDFTVSTAIVATDNALVALGKLQAQINGKQAALGFSPEDVANKNNVALNASTTEYPTSGLVKSELATVRAIAEGRNKAVVFATLAALDAWLAVPANTATLAVGDNLYILDINTPDYWWDGATRQVLETASVDLTGYVQTIRTINGHALSADVSIVPADITGFNSAALAAAPAEQAASTTVSGVLSLATNAEAIAATNTTKAIVPTSLAAKLADWLTSTLQSTFAPAAASPIGKQSIFIPAPSMSDGTTTATYTASTGTYDFSTSTAQDVLFKHMFPKAWNAGTITFKAIFSQASTTAGGVAWGLKVASMSSGDSSTPTYGSQVVVTMTVGTTGINYMTAESAVVTVGNTPAKQDLLVFNLQRVVADAADTMGANAQLVGIMIFYTVDAATDV